MEHMKTTQELIDQIAIERNLSPSTKYNYKLSVEYFEKHIGMTLVDLIEIAKDEERNPNIIWSESTLRNSIISFRSNLYRKHKEKTAEQYLSKILAILKHIGITVYDLPSFSKKQTIKGTPIYPEDLLDRETIQKCIDSAPTVIVKPLALGFTSTGLSVIDMLNISIQDYLHSTKDYHNANNIYQAIQEMENKDVIPVFKSSRRKTGINYITFASPEFVKATNAYLLTRENLQLDDPLFEITRRHVNRVFQRINDNLNLGKVNDEVSKFSPKMMRIYHASQLHEAGVSSDMIDILQGRTPKGLIYKSYIRIKTDVLRDEYIKALPYLVISETSKFKTELDVVKEENKKFHEIVEDIDKRIESKIQEAMEKYSGPLTDDEFRDLFS